MLCDLQVEQWAYGGGQAADMAHLDHHCGHFHGQDQLQLLLLQVGGFAVCWLRLSCCPDVINMRHLDFLTGRPID
jgi:hypothetical protein